MLRFSPQVYGPIEIFKTLFMYVILRGQLAKSRVKCHFFCFPNFVFIMRLICQINGFLTLFIRRTILNSFEDYFSFWPICTFVACSLYSFTPKPLIYDGCDFTFFRIDSDQIVQIDLNSCFCLTSGAMEDKNKIFLLNDINP